MAQVKVRFPPSPTGYCHVGTARMAVLNFLFARKQGGTIVYRSEDTDRERSTAEFEDDIIEQLHWLGLSWETFYRSSEMRERHAEAMRSLIDSGAAYLSQEQSKREAGKTVTVVRLKNPGTVITFTDLIRGNIAVDTTDLGDFVIGRSVDDPLYHLAVVVDDAADGITHIIRGEDHISNTPRQILIQEALGYSRPVYAHFPLHLAADRSKLSKRKGDVAVRSYREKGYLPEALFNYLAVLGWTPPSQKEVLSAAEMIASFDLHDLHKSGAIFDAEKLRWFNRQYVERMNDDAFAAYALPPFLHALEAHGVRPDSVIIARILPLLKERLSIASDAVDRAGEFLFFFRKPALIPDSIAEKKSTSMEAREHLKHILAVLETIPEDTWNADVVKSAISDYAAEKGRGAVLWPLRYALSGEEKSPDPFTLAGVLGKDETIARVSHAIDILENL